LRIRGLKGETRSKPLAEQEEAARYGRALERAIEDSGLTKQEAAFRLGYTEQSMISRWIAGQENPPMPRLFVKLGERFKQAWVLQMAKQTNGVNVETVMRIAEAKLA
jgi:transcriptional regulator with XRE-family HTH domain